MASHEFIGSEELSSLIKQLGEAYSKLEAIPGALEGTVPWGEIEEHLRKLESTMKQNFDGLEDGEKQFEERKSEASIFLSHREAEISSKEQEFIDRVQLLKDAAVSAIGDMWQNCKPTDDTEDEVSGFNDDVSDHSASPKAKPPTGLTQICEQMDAKGLWNSALQNKGRLSSFVNELSKALVSAPDPAQLVLDSMKLSGSTRGYTAVAIMQVMAAAIGSDHTLSPNLKQQAKTIADEWKGGGAEAEAFLQLLATFSIANEFDEAELCNLALTFAHSRRAPELYRAVGLTPRMPGIVEELIKSGKQIDAVRLVTAFNLGESYSPTELLETYMKEKITTAAPGGEQGDAVNELSTLKAVINCVVDCGLEQAYLLNPLRKRVGELEKSRPDKRSEWLRRPQHKKSKKSRYRKGPSRFVSTGVAVQNAASVAPNVGVMGGSVRYPSAVSDYLGYGAPNPSVYPTPVADQRAYYYAQGQRVASNLQNAVPSTYAGYNFPIN